jgi:hypothetical protein
LCKLDINGEVDLISTTSSSSFTWPTTFGKRHHSLPYNILCDFLQRLHSNEIFSLDSQVGVPKLGLLLFQNFGHSYFSSNQTYLDHSRAIYYSPQKYLSNNVWHILIGVHLTFTLKGIVVGNQIFNLTPTLLKP